MAGKFFGKTSKDQNPASVPTEGEEIAAEDVVVVHQDTGEPVLSFENLDVQFKTEFGRVHAVRGVSIDVHPGEVVALVGESGSG